MRDRPLKICHIGKYYFPATGGIESHVQTLAHAQAAMGHTVRVMCVNHVPGRTHTEWDSSIAVTRFRRFATVAKFDVCADVVRSLQEVDADILHMHTPNPSMVVMLMFARPRVPLVVTHHSDVVAQRLRGAMFGPVETQFYGRARRVFATSPMYVPGSSILRSCGHKLEVLPLGIELKPFLEPSPGVIAQSEQIKRQTPGPIWLSVGRLIYYKAMLHAVRALVHAPGTLIVIGEGPDRDAILREAGILGVSQRVVLKGRLSQVELLAHYHAATALWFPSNARSEAFGLVQVEAMASSCPVINCGIPHSGVPWVSPNEVSGLTAPIDNPRAFAELAVWMSRDPLLRQRLASQARQRAIDLFDHRTMARKTVQVYRNVLTEIAAAQIHPPVRRLKDFIDRMKVDRPPINRDDATITAPRAGATNPETTVSPVTVPEQEIAPDPRNELSTSLDQATILQ
jgi:rhamnosyl/mannosyltransferase